MNRSPYTLEHIPTPPYDVREILRYAGARKGDSYLNLPTEADGPLKSLLDECLEEASAAGFADAVVWGSYDIKRPRGATAPALDFGFMQVESTSLSRALQECETCVVFATTLGISIDRLIARYTVISPAKALLFQAIGAERIEALCDAFCQTQRERLQAVGHVLKPRFSPGFGDLPLNFQRNILDALNAQRLLGITLNDSFLMSPSKSVTALAGIA